ncbi:ribonuclease P protein subunit p30 isoform X1 [Alosa sapidissima]|uniref:ribonuclease P protein subunit p30 isoform X1 n=1 Tax=Alosa sapidissima TaxID=34773 RepID=UPI001C0981FB|nr:ribonuclease P protein subunit p30 isoform X1 [Alosa sapidissima]
MVCRMATFMDLNINFTKDKKTLQNIIETAAHLGYSTVAINYTLESQQKKPEIPKPTSISDLFDKLPVVQGRSRPIRVLNRLTVVATDPSHFRPTTEYKAFDLVAVLPKTEKLFHAACMTFEVDIICVTVTEKQPFHFKRAPVNGAIDRGVFFEIVYTPAIRDSTMRRYTIGNSLGLMETCKGKGVILSSGAERPLELRGPYDIANLGIVFGLSEGDAKAAVSTNCRSVVINGETRTTAFGIIRTMKKPQPAPTSSEEKEDEREIPASKRVKMEH